VLHYYATPKGEQQKCVAYFMKSALVFLHF
jgi:hypothetical protein